MTSAAPLPKKRAARPWQTPQPLVGLLILNLLLIVAVATWWPIYDTPWMYVTVAGALLLANGLTIVSYRSRWPFLKTLLVGAGSYLVGAFLLAVPGLYSGQSTVLDAALGVLTAPVVGVKNILTLQVPLGDYQQVLAILFFFVFVLAAAATSISLRATRLWWLAVPLAWVLLVGGIALGSSAHLGDWHVGSWNISGSYQLLAGIVATLISLLWVSSRQRAQRRQELRESLELADTAPRGSSLSLRISRTMGATMLLIVAVAGGTLASTTWLSGHTRDTLRSASQPWDQITEEIGPLTKFRMYQDSELYGTDLFTVTETDATRVRLATLTAFDGTTFEAIPTGLTVSELEGGFQRVPSTLPAGDGAPLAAKIRIDADQGPWTPLVGELSSIDFQGADRAALTDGFFFNRENATGVQLAPSGLSSGTTYTVQARDYLLPAQAIAGFTPEGGAPLMGENDLPPALLSWVEMQEVTPDGSGFLTLVERLRARGYLSHGLTESEATAQTWVSGLDNYSFAPSRAGHSAGRINAIFRALLERELTQANDATDDLLVAAVGDEEQFAVAAALLADNFGFRARIAIGALLTEGDPGSAASCEGGTCRGENITVWVEIQDATTGEWAAVDVRPQYENPIAPKVEERSDPKNTTPVDPLAVDPVDPPEPNPVQADIDPTDPEPETGMVAPWTDWMRIAGLVLSVLLLIFTVPFLILFGKRMRRKYRRKQATTEGAILGGWDEFIDLMVDRGWQIPSTNTRRQTAESLYRSVPAVDYLAAVADQATFTSEGIAPQVETTYWSVVGKAKTESETGLSWYQKLAGALSLRSFKSRDKVDAGDTPTDRSLASDNDMAGE